MRRWSLLWCGLVAVAGCGGDLPSVTGTVTLDGAPLDGATVSFVPSDPKAFGGSAKTGSDGKYRVMTPQGKRGLPPGNYKVVISKIPLPPGAEEGVGPAITPATAPPEMVPAPYSDPEKSPLTATVDSSGKPIDFALTGAKKKK